MISDCLFVGILLVGASHAHADWTPWQTIQGDASHGLDWSTNTGSFAYDGGARKIFIHYRNRYSDAFKGIVVLEVHGADGKVTFVNDSLDLKSGATDFGSVTYEIASTVRPTEVRQQNQPGLYGNLGVEGATVTPPPSEITFSGNWTDWQPLSQGAGLALRRTRTPTNSVFNYQLRNDSNVPRSISWHYQIPGGATMSQAVIVPARGTLSLEPIPSSSISIDSVK
jgi:hypothetical protein